MIHLLDLLENQLNLDVRDIMEMNCPVFNSIEVREDTGCFSAADMIRKLYTLQQKQEKIAVVVIIPPDKSMLVQWGGWSTMFV